MDLNISDTLSTFRFSTDPDFLPDFSSLIGLKESYDHETNGSDLESTPIPSGPAQDFFGDEDYDGSGPVGFDDAMSIGGDDEAVPIENYGGGSVGMVAPGDTHVPFDPRRQGQELVMALVGGNVEEGMFDYFDRGSGKAWAGAEHWKLRKVSRKGEYLYLWQFSSDTIYRRRCWTYDEST